MKYRITIKTSYGKLTVDDIEAKSEAEAIGIAYSNVFDEIENYSEVDEVYCYG